LTECELLVVASVKTHLTEQSVAEVAPPDRKAIAKCDPPICVSGWLVPTGLPEIRIYSMDCRVERHDGDPFPGRGLKTGVGRVKKRPSEVSIARRDLEMPDGFRIHAQSARSGICSASRRREPCTSPTCWRGLSTCTQTPSPGKRSSIRS